MTKSPFILLHCADLHLDAVLGDSVNASQLNELSKEEQTKLRDAPLLALNKISQTAISRKVNVVLIAGDIFNRRDGVSSDIRTRSAFTNFLRDLTDNSIQVFIALGNHDPLATISDLSAPWPNSVHLFSSRAPETHKLQFDGINVAIHGVSYQNNDESRNLADMFPQKLNDSLNIGVLHTNVGGNENHSNYAPTNLETLQAKQYDYFALGHIHKREVLSEHPFVSYSGNTQALSAKPSESMPKGCTVISIDPESKDIEQEFITTDTIRYEKIEVEVQEDLHVDDFASFIANDIVRKLENTSILYLIRLKIKLASENRSLDTSLLRDLVNEQRSNFIVTKIEYTSKSEHQNILASHVFFEIIEKNLETLEKPTPAEMYGKKHEQIANIIGINKLDEDFAKEVKEFIENTYVEQTSTIQSTKK